MEEFDNLKEQTFIPGQQVLITGNGELSNNKSVFPGYHGLERGQIYTVLKEEFFHKKNSEYKGMGRLYSLKSNKTDYTQNVFAFDLKPSQNTSAFPTKISFNLPDI